MNQEYSEVYDKEYKENPFYNSPGSSPAIIYSTNIYYNNPVFYAGVDSVFDIGCGQGFLLDWFQKQFKLKNLFGVDVSGYAIEKGIERNGVLKLIEIDKQTRLSQYYSFIKNIEFFTELNFDIITCFDVIEHLDEKDAIELLNTILKFKTNDCKKIAFSISLRESSQVDQFGKNLHRTVKSKEWWMKIIESKIKTYSLIKDEKQKSFSIYC